MEPKQIHDLIEILSKSNVSSLEIEHEGFRLRLEKTTAQPVAFAAAPANAPAVQTAVPPTPAVPEAQASSQEEELFDQETPFVGTFYRSPGPDADPFVDIGSRVKKGQVLCIVEAMKLMNEIEAEIDGEIVEVLAENGQPVEYGQVLFRIRPS